MIPHNRFTCWKIAAALAACSPSLLANGSRLPSQDAEIVARGNTGVAGVDTSAAVYYNPAGLTKVTRPEVKAGVYIGAPQTDFTHAATGRKVEEESGTFFQPHLYAAMPFGSQLTLGAALFSPYGESTEWAPTSGFAGLATKSEILYVTGSLALAWKVTPTFSIGAGVQLSHAEVDLSRMQAIAPGVVRAFNFKGDDKAVSGNAGVQWQVARDHTLGLHYQRKTDFRFSGTASLAGVLSREGEAGWVFPDNIGVGWRWAFAPEWKLDLSYDWTNWERLDVVRLNAGPLSTAVPLHWMGSAYYGAGVTRTMSRNWWWSAGYIFSENSVPDATLSPSLPDVDRHLLTGGIGWKGEHWNFVATIQQGLRSKRTKAGPAPDGLGGSAAGTYRNQIFSGALQATYHF